jgi:hypothetical protein
VAVGSPVNLPLLCNGPIEFGTAVIGDLVGTIQNISCQARVGVQITSITPKSGQYWNVSRVPPLPLTLAKNQNVTFMATFLPKDPGPLSDDILLNTTNTQVGFALNTPVGVRGTGKSNLALLDISPNTVSFPGIVTGENIAGSNRSVVFSNAGKISFLFQLLSR